MDLRLNRADLLSELTPMQGVVERKTTIPVLSHVLLSVHDGKLRLAATDLDVSLTSYCDAEILEEGSISLNAKKIFEIVRSLASDEVHLVQEEPKVLTIKAGRSRFTVRGLDPEDFPTLPLVEDAKRIEIPFSEFRQMISKVLFAVSAEESRFQLNGALLKLRSGALEIVATDGHRLALVERLLHNNETEEATLVPRKALIELNKVDHPGSLLYCRGEHHLSFRLGRRELICRVLEGTFPDYERVIAKDNERKVVFGRKPLIEAVHRVALMTGDRARAIRLHFYSGNTVISAVNADLGEAVEELASNYLGDEFRIGLNPDYLLQFLTAVETENVRLEMKDDNTQCVCYPINGLDSRYLCVIMPMRI